MSKHAIKSRLMLARTIKRHTSRRTAVDGLPGHEVCTVHTDFGLVFHKGLLIARLNESERLALGAVP